LTLTNSSGADYGLYALLKQWDEATANWTRSAVGSNWSTSGASSSADRGNTALGNFDTSRTGKTQITLNAAGLALLEQWILDPANNHGFIFQNYPASNGLDLSSSESSNVNDRPKLTVTYKAPA